MVKIHRALWFYLAVLAVLSSLALAQAPVTDDTFVTSASPNSNNGTSPSLVVQAPAGWTFLKYDLSRLPAGTTSSSVTKATVKLYTTAVTGQGSFDLFRVDSAWAENTLTYSNTTTPFKSALALTLTPITTGNCGATPVQCVTTSSKYVIVDITSIVKTWIDFQNGVSGSHANNGIAFKPTASSTISVTFESKESSITSHDSEVEIDLAGGAGSGVSSVTATAPLANTGTASNPNIALTGLIPSGNLSGTYAISITGNAATATSATSATTAATATNATQLGGVAAANYARVDQANTFTGVNILGNSTAGTGGLLIPPSGTGANKNSFLLNLQSTGASATNTFAFQASGTPALNFQFCNSSANCTPANTGLSIANTGIITFAAGQTFPGSGSGTVTNFSAGSLSPLFTTSVSTPTTTPALSFILTAQAANSVFAGPASGGNAAPSFRALGAADIPSLAESKITNLTTDLAAKATASAITGATNTKITYNSQGIVTAGAQALFSDLGGTIAPSQVGAGTYGINISGNAASITGNITEGQVTNLTTDLSNLSATAATKVPLSAVGAANGVASLDGTTHVPLAQLPSLSGLYVDLTSNQSVSGNKIFTSKVDLSGATVTLPVRVITGAPPAAACAAGQMVFQSDAAVGAQLFVCNSSLNGWVLVTDTSSLSSSLQASINAEAATRAAADTTLQNNISAETTRATGAENTISTNLSNEVTRATGAENTISTNLSNETSARQAADTAEAATRAAADTALATSISNETTRATGAETTISTNLSNEITRATGAEATKADLVKPVQLDNTALTNGSCAAVNALVLNPAQPSGQQLFVCRDIGGGTLEWELINDDGTTASNANAYTDAQVAAEAAARAAADNTLQNNISAETTRATGAENTISSNLASEVSRATGAENSITTNLNSEITRATGAEAAEAATRAAADTALSAAITAETSRATGAENTISTNLSNEISRATAAEATKADLITPVQLDNAAAVNATCTTVNALVLNPADPSGQQLFICRDIGGGTLEWELINDDGTTSSNANAYTDAQVAAEAAARLAADNAEAAARAAADVTLQSNIDAEATRATGAENTISTNLAGEITRATGAEAAEAATRAAADAALSASITTETSRATGVESTLQTNIDNLNTASAKLAGGNAFTGDQTITAGKFDASGATATLPVQTTNTLPPASGSPSACVTGQMLMYPNGPSGQQLFICNAALDGWNLVNDDSTNTSSTNAAIAAETAARIAADAAEAAARSAADTTLQNNIDAEAATRAAADTTLQANIDAEAASRTAADAAEATARAAADAAEAAARAAADLTLQANIDAEAAARAAADTAETNRATAAEATKADLITPVQTDNTALTSGACTAVNAMVLNPTQPSGQQLFVCRDIGGSVLQWELINDDGTTSSNANAYTDAQVAAEAALRAAADATETAARQAADVTLQSNIDAEAARATAAEGVITSNLNSEISRATGAEAAEAATRAAADTALSAAITTETSRATGAETTLQTNIDTLSAASAKLATDNIFTGNNTFTGKLDASGSSATLPVQTTNTAPPASGVANSCVTGQMLMYPNGPSGQQLFICNAALDGWNLVNDDSTNTSSTNAAIAAETAARIAADATLQSNIDAEAATRAAADTTLQANIDAEAAARTAADTAEATARAAADAAEALARAAGDAAALASANTYTDAETARATAAEATKANLVGPNSFTGDQTFSAGKLDASGDTATLPVQTTNVLPPASGSPSACVTGQMLMYPNGPSGQQLFICNAALDGWNLVNDDSASSSSTNAAIAAETAARIAADAAEAAARSAADTTLQNNIDAEAATRAAADTTLQNNIDAEAAARTAAESTETAARIAADAAEAAARAAADLTLQSNIDAETTRATTAENNISAASAQLAGNNSFTGNNTFTGGKLDASGDTATLPVQTTLSTPPTSGVANACVAGQMLMYTAGLPGQQLFVCNSALDGWDLVNDDSASTSSTNAAIAAETAARIAADAAEAAARSAADTTLQNNIDAEAATRAAADTTLQNNIDAEAAARTAAESTETAARIAADAAEAAARAAADVTLQANIDAEATARAAADAAELARATAAEATKADLVAPVQVDNAAAVNGTCTTVNALVLNPGDPSGQQLFICRDIGGSVLEWQLINDDNSTTSAANAYTDQQVAAEAAARLAADNAEAAARAAADATLQANIDAETSRATTAEGVITSNLNSEITRATGAETAEAATRAAADTALSGAIATETSRATGAETTLQTNIDNLSAASAKLATDNIFTGNNTFTGKVDMSGSSATLPVQTTNSQPQTTGTSCVTGQMLMYPNGPSGQQLFICNATLDGWNLVNDDSASSAADHTYTDNAVAAEAAARTAADTTLQANIDAEAATRAAADTTLQSNIDAEAAARAAAESTETAARIAADAAEAAARQAADLTLQANIDAEAAARAAADTAETTRATGVEAAKANLVGPNSFTADQTFTAGKLDATGDTATLPVQTTNSQPQTTGTSCLAGQMLMYPNGTSGQQLYVCNSTLDGWNLVNDDSAATTAANAYTDAQVAAEAAARSAADSAEAAARAAAVSAEATARAAGDVASNTYTDAQVAAEAAARSVADAATLAAAQAYASNAANITTGVLGVANGGTGVNSTSTAANKIFASPSGSTGAPTFRAMTAADLPAPQNTRAICYIAGSDNSSVPIDTTYSQISYFNNMIGNMTITAASCQVDNGQVSMQIFKNDLATPITNAVQCNGTPGAPFQTVSLSGTPSLSLNDTLDLSITALGTTTAKRLTVCVAGTVN